MQKLRTHLSYANVIGTLALFVALGGSAFAVTAARNSVTSKSIKNESIKSLDVLDDSLTGQDLNEETLTFPPGSIPPGAKGDKGDKGDPGMSGFHFQSVTSDSNSDSPKEIFADCPAGEHVVSAFWDIAGGKTGSAPNQVANVVVDKLLPTAANGILGQHPTRVYLQAYESAATTSNWSLRVGVICAKVTL